MVDNLTTLLAELETDGDVVSAAAIKAKLQKLQIAAPQARQQGILEESNTIHVEVQRKLRDREAARCKHKESCDRVAAFKQQIEELSGFTIYSRQTGMAQFRL